MPFASTLVVGLIQASVLPDTIVARTLPVRGVFEYSAGINHAKTVLFDDDWLMVGSANSDNRSMRLNFELNVLVHAADAAADLEKMMREDFAASREVRLAELAHRPFSRRLLEAALRPLAPLL